MRMEPFLRLTLSIVSKFEQRRPDFSINLANVVWRLPEQRGD
jgi:hypothetical protein